MKHALAMAVALAFGVNAAWAQETPPLGEQPLAEIKGEEKPPEALPVVPRSKK